MNTIAEHFSQADKISSLEKRLHRAIEKSVYWSGKYNKLNESIGVKKPLSKTQKAVLLIKSINDNKMLLKQIAATCNLATGTVERLSSQVKRGLK